MNASDNEHIGLRRWVEGQIGKRVGRAAWGLAVDQRFVEEALDPDLEAREELATFLASVLRVSEEQLKAALRSQRSRRSATARTSNRLARILAISRLAADDAANDEAILGFRSRVLGRPDPMTASEAEAYLERPQARGLPRRDWMGELNVLKYQNRSISVNLHVASMSPLDQLRRLSEELAEAYPWQPSQAAAFALEGLTPLATPFVQYMPQVPATDRPPRARLIMEVDLWTPAKAVLAAYRDAQRKVLPGFNRPVSRRAIDLVNFVMTNRPATWPEILRRWNTAHPHAKYGNYRQVRLAFKRAEAALLYPRYRIWFDQQ